MESVTKFFGDYLNAPAYCITTGHTVDRQIVYSWFNNMNGTISALQAALKKNPIFANGFHAVGFSQGNVILRGFIQTMNDPPARTWISVHGPVGGQGAVPGVDPQTTFGFGSALAKLVGHLCQDPFLVKRVMPCSYFRVSWCLVYLPNR